MLLPLGAAAIMATVLLWELARPRLRGSLLAARHELVRLAAETRHCQSSSWL